MDQELKQRLIGVAVITFLAAWLIPMPFNDPVDNPGQVVNELTVPEVPSKLEAVKPSSPLPDKTTDVVAPVIAPPAANGTVPDVSTFEPDVEVAPADVVIESEEKETPPPPPVSHEAETQGEKLTIKPLKSAVVKEDNKAKKDPKAVATTPVQPPKPSKAELNAAKIEESAMKALQTKNPNAAPVKVYLQVGTFSQKNNALTLQESLKQQGFAASVKESSSERGPIFRVRIGPILDKDKAQTMKNKLSQINVNSLAVAEE